MNTISALRPRPPAPDDRIFLLFFLNKAAELKRFRSHPPRMYTLSIQRWVGVEVFKVARRVVLDPKWPQQDSSRYPSHPPKHARLCNSHRCALFTNTISALRPRPPAPDDRIFPPFFLNKAAELKRFRSHPLSSAVTRDEQGKLKRTQWHGACLGQLPQPICRRLSTAQTSRYPRTPWHQRRYSSTPARGSQAPNGSDT